jgi:hypothetical protein
LIYASFFFSSQPALRSRATLYSARGVHGWRALCACTFDRARVLACLFAHFYVIDGQDAADTLSSTRIVSLRARTRAVPLPLNAFRRDSFLLCLLASVECVGEIFGLGGLGGRAASRALCAIKACVCQV